MLDEVRAHEEEIREKFGALGEGLRIRREWHVDFQFAYPETGYAEIPVMWADMRKHNKIYITKYTSASPGVHLESHSVVPLPCRLGNGGRGQ